MWKGARIKHPVALHTAWGGMRKALHGQDSARKGSATPEWHGRGEWALQGPRLQGRMDRRKLRSLTQVQVSVLWVGSAHTARLTCILDEEASR